MLEVSRHPLYSDATRVIIEAAIRLEWGIFFSPFFSLLSSKKHVGILKKKKKKKEKKVCLFVD
jgi:hypothetical protein